MIIRSILTLAVLSAFVFGAAANAQNLGATGMIGDAISFTVEPQTPDGPAVVVWLTGADANDD